MSREGRQWGVSPAADEVRALVVGLAPSEAGRRILVALQAYIDDSVGEDEFVLAGHIASAEQWEAFSRDWEYTLPLGIRDKDGYYFKMSEMAALPERMERVPAFWRVMEQHTLTSISMRFKLSDFRAARERILVPGVVMDWTDWDKPHYAAFRAMLDVFHERKEQLVHKIPMDQPVDFIFDEHTMKKPLLEAWDAYLAGRPHLKSRYGSTPIFRDDRKFLPLQAADLWAWWIREWYESGVPMERHFEDLKFGKWNAAMGKYHLIIDASQDAMVRNFMALAAEFLPPTHYVYDRAHPERAGLRGWKID